MKRVIPTAVALVAAALAVAGMSGCSPACPEGEELVIDGYHQTWISNGKGGGYYSQTPYYDCEVKR